MTALLVPLGILLPDDTLRTGVFSVLAAFVAINTVMYVALAVAKVLPKIYLSDWVTRADRRTRNRSIYPDRHPRSPR